MTQEVDSAALALADRAYGLSGIDAEQQTRIDDGNVSQTRELNPIARRSRVPFGEGLFIGTLQNVHSVAAELVSFVNPYIPVNIRNDFPSPVDDSLFDIYLVGASAKASSLAAVVYAALGMNWPGTLQGVSDTAAGGPTAPGDIETPLMGWNDATLFPVAAVGQLMSSSNGDMWKETFIRVPRGAQITFRTKTDGVAAVTFTSVLLFGIFPIALGQDIR